MKQVLIVDDSEQIRERIVALLAESPQICIAGEAGDGLEAFEAVRKTHPDTVILDIRLPGQNGMALLKAFKSLYPQMAVIMLTNLDDDRYRRQCLRLGADHFLSKSMDFDKIVGVILGETST